MEEALVKKMIREAYGLRMAEINRDVRGLVKEGRYWRNVRFAMYGSPIRFGEEGGGASIEPLF
jgi:hypothetical protein